jgi:acetyl esterase/lipase
MEQRVLFARLMATRPRPAGVVTSELRLGGTPAIGISTGDPRPDQPAVLYFHGGGYAVGAPHEFWHPTALELGARFRVEFVNVEHRR